MQSSRLQIDLSLSPTSADPSRRLTFAAMPKSRSLLLALALLLIAAYVAYDMTQLYAAEELWGYRPLYLFGALYGAVMAALWSPDRQRRLLLVLASGILLTLGWPPSPLFPLLFVGFVPLLLLVEDVAAKRVKGVKRRIFGYAFLTFVGWNIGTTYWVANTALVAGIFAILANSALMSLPILLYYQTKKVMPRVGMIGLLGYWLSWEYLHLNWEVTWPWLTLGNGLAAVPAIAQWYEFTGVFGGSLWIMGVNALLYKAYLERTQTGRKRTFRLVEIGMLLSIPVIVSLVLYTTYTPRGETSEVVVVQPNYEPHYQKRTVPITDQQRNFIQLAKNQLTPETDYLLLPETIFGGFDTLEIGREKRTAPLRTLVDEYPGLKLVTGLSPYHVLRPDAPSTFATRTRERGGSPMRFEGYNAAVQWESRRPGYQLHLKTKLVPGAEFLPYKNLLFFMKPLVDKLGGSLEGLGHLGVPTVFTSEHATVAPIICYESVYGQYVAKYVYGGAELLFIMTNDGWWDRTAGHRQHLQYASLRAIENRRAIARSANTGISGFIDQRGDLQAHSAYNEATALRGELRRNNQRTIYTRYGDLIGRFASFFGVVLLLQMLVKTFMHRRNISPTTP